MPTSAINSGGTWQKPSRSRAFAVAGAEFEKFIQYFNELVQGRTAVYISHRLSSAKVCDRIIVLENGEIVEQGTFDSLYGEGGIL
jgi:ABC-type multidrug transport system fused ATPase/permease subunit